MKVVALLVLVAVVGLAEAFTPAMRSSCRAPGARDTVSNIYMMVRACLGEWCAQPWSSFAPRCPCAQRHGVRTKRLGRPADQRKALLRALTTEVLRHGQITTTLSKCKEVRKTVDKMISLAKEGSLHSRRQAIGYMYDKQLVHALFEAVNASHLNARARVFQLIPSRSPSRPGPRPLPGPRGGIHAHHSRGISARRQHTDGNY